MQQALQFESVEKISWRQERVRDFSKGYEPYHPRKCRDIILATVSLTEWTDSSDIYDATGMCPYLVGWTLDFLLKWNRLERVELYIGAETIMGVYDRTKRPAIYRGFSWGYRQIKKEVKA